MVRDRWRHQPRAQLMTELRRKRKTVLRACQHVFIVAAPEVGEGSKREGAKP